VAERIALSQMDLQGHNHELALIIVWVSRAVGFSWGGIDQRGVWTFDQADSANHGDDVDLEVLRLAAQLHDYEHQQHTKPIKRKEIVVKRWNCQSGVASSPIGLGQAPPPMAW